MQDENFNNTVRQKYAKDWADLNAEWQAYIATLDYGFDFERMAINFEPDVRLIAVVYLGWATTAPPPPPRPAVALTFVQ